MLLKAVNQERKCSKQRLDGCRTLNLKSGNLLLYLRSFKKIVSIGVIEGETIHELKQRIKHETNKIIAANAKLPHKLSFPYTNIKFFDKGREISQQQQNDDKMVTDLLQSNSPTILQVTLESENSLLPGGSTF